MAIYDKKKWDAVISAASAAAAVTASEKALNRSRSTLNKAAPIVFKPILLDRRLESLARKAAPAPAKPTPQLDEPTAAQTAQDEAAFLTGKSLAPDRLQRLAQHGTTPSGRIGAMMALGKF
jgi:hypothetical protein